MLAKLKALWAAVSYRFLTTKDWLSAKSFSITGLHAAYVVAGCLVALGVAYHLGKWDGSVHGLKQMAYGFMIPAADPPKQEVVADAPNLVGELAQCQFELADAQAKLQQGQSAVKVAANLPPPAVVPPAACKPVVRYFRPRQTTVLQDLGLAK